MPASLRAGRTHRPKARPTGEGRSNPFGLRMMQGLSPRSTPMLLMWAMLTVAAFGMGLYWIDPAVHTAGDGLWLAFVSAATVGYGDIVPSTTAGRMFAVATILVGNGTLSLITASLTTVFLNNEDRERQKEMHREVLSLRHQQVEMQHLIKALLATRAGQAEGEPAPPAQVVRPGPDARRSDADGDAPAG